MSNTKTARSQFFEDISLVLDNDYESYKILHDKAKRLNDAWKLAEFIKTYVENKVEQAIGKEQIGALLIRQICFNWELDTYHAYAVAIMAELDESAGV